MSKIKCGDTNTTEKCVRNCASSDIVTLSYLDKKIQNDTKGIIKVQSLLLKFLCIVIRKAHQKINRWQKVSCFFAGYFAEHHISFAHADHLLTL